MRDGDACLVAFLLGGIGGASVAMMLTPRSRREARLRLERGVEAFESRRDELAEALSMTPLRESVSR